MVWQCGTKKPRQQQQHTKQLCVVGLLFSAHTRTQWPECSQVFVPLLRLASPIGSAFDAERTATKFWKFFFFFIFVQSVCIFRLSSALSRLAFSLIGRTWLRGAWKAFIVHRAKALTPWTVPFCNFSSPAREHLMARRHHIFIGYDNYITVHNVTLWKTFSRGHKKEMEPQKSALNVSSFMSHSSRTVGEGTEGKSQLLLAFLMSRCRPLSSAKINIWALVVPLCLIRGHPGLHIQEFIDPENFIQSNSRPWAASACFYYL